MTPTHAVTSKTQEPSRLAINRSTALVIIFATLSPFTVTLVGQIYLSELFALLCLPLVGTWALLRQSPSARQICAAYGLLLLGLAVADLMNATPFPQLARGWANVAFATVSFLFLAAVLRRNPRAAVPFLLALAAARFFVASPEVEGSLLGVADNAFKVLVVPWLSPLMLVVLYLTQRQLGTRTALILCVLFGIFLIAVGARSSSLSYLLGSALFLYSRSRTASLSLRSQVVAAVPYILSFLLVAYLSYGFYVDAVLSNPNTSNAYVQLARADNPYNPIELIAQGRTEIFVAAHAIASSPILGSGSWAQDSEGIYTLLLAELKQIPTERLHHLLREASFIPTHSVLMTSWLWGGALGLAGILLILGKSIARLGVLSRLPPAFGLVICVITLDMLWNILFSPIGHLRTTMPLALALLLNRTELASRRGPTGPAHDCNDGGDGP